MWNELRFGIFAIKQNIKNSAELRASFVLTVVGMMINNVSFVILWGFFVRMVGDIGGWTVMDIIGLQAFTAIGYGVVYSMFVGIRNIPEYVASGAFDRFLLSPKNVLLRAATSAFHSSAVGDIFFGVICGVIYGYTLHVTWIQCIMAAVLLLASIMVFVAVGIFAVSIAFYVIDGTAISMGYFHLFITPALFHGGIFQGVMRFVFTFIIPSLVVGALPVEVIKSVSGTQLLMVVAVSVAWLCLSILFFYTSLRRYESTNLMTFGQ